MFNHILLAYDATEASDLAFERALALAQEAHAPLHVVAVAWSAEVETHASLDLARARCWESLQLLRRRGADAQVPVDVEVLEGDCPTQIVAAADRLGADLLVIGHRRRSLLSRLAEASVAKRVIDHAHCSVMVAC
ncbi:universal stress protein [Variovorax sp. PBL-E5]|uniref:universal stress protein n=1 Tax=Variovorax sp. PBL-E5 TaxID=434014 RepID=UPI001317330E|nr:universal stress protein [Variovorax sp. PBL-E5]VTU31429.1 universal stress protein F [Variovorax sp. PBL-E5]